MLSSCALRAQESIDLLAERLEYRGRLDYLEELYMTPSDEILDIVSAQEEEVNTLFVLAHSPWIHELALRLSGEHIGKFPPMAVAAIDFGIESWQDLADGLGTLDFFIYPKQFEHYMPRQIRAYLPR